MKRIMLIAAAALAVPAIALAAGLSQSAAVESGASYIASLQQADGGFQGASVGQNMDAIVALRSAGYDPAKVTSSAGTTAVDFIKANAAAATKPADAAKVALGAAAAGLDPTNVGGTDVQAAISASFDASTGRYAADDFSQSIAMLGLACTGGSVPSAAVTALKGAEIQADGGWGFSGASDPDTTAIAVQALIAAGVPVSDPAVAGGLAYFKSAQLADGGWGFAPDSNVSSTAYVVQALIAAGQDPATYAKGSADPISYLLSQQQPDGSFAGYSVALAAEQALPALAGRTFCDAPTTAITHTGAPAKPSITPTPTASTTPTATETPSVVPTGTPTVAPTTPAASATTTSPTRSATSVPGHTRTPVAPNTGSGTTPGGPATAMMAAALVLVTLSGGLGIAALRRR